MRRHTIVYLIAIELTCIALASPLPACSADTPKPPATPPRTVPGGKPAPDPVLIERLKNIKTGDVVEAELTAGPARNTFTLVDVDIFREPQVGEFVKLDTIKEGTRSVPAIVLNVLDEPQTIALPTGTALRPTDAAAVSLARRLKPGTYVR